MSTNFPRVDAKEAAPESTTQLHAGVLLLLGSTALLTGMEVGAKLLTKHFPVWELVWAKYFFHLLLAPLLLSSFGGLSRLIATRKPVLQVSRSLLLFGATATYFFALKHIPLVTANVIGFTAPLLTALLGVAALRERSAALRVAAASAGLVGVWIVVHEHFTVSFTPALLLPLATALCYSGYSPLTRRMAFEDSPFTTLLWTPAVGAILGSIAVYDQFVAPRTAFEGVQLGLLGGTSCIGHLLLIQAYRRAPASYLAPFQYLQLPFAIAISFFVFGTLPTAWTYVGGTVIVAAGLAVLWAERGARADAGESRTAGRGDGLRLGT